MESDWFDFGHRSVLEPVAISRGKCTDWPRLVYTPASSPSVGRGALWLKVSQRPPVLMEEFLKRKGGSVTRREMGIYTEQVKPQPTAGPIMCRRLYCQVVGQNEAEPPSERAARPGLQYHPHGAVQVAHSRWQPQSPLYFTLYPPFPFWNHVSSQENGRRLMNCKHKWGTWSMPPSEYK